jgi:hypothetical protein
MDLHGHDAHWLGPVDEGEISRVERLLGVHFPSDYRRFLGEQGAGSIGSTELYGLGCDQGRLPSLLWLIGCLEADGFVRPTVLLPVSEVGNGDYVAVLAAPLGDHAAGVAVYWSPRRDDRLDLEAAAGSFDAWLRRRLAPRKA